MLYVKTAREWWSGARTAFRFYATAAVLGLATTLVSLLAFGCGPDGRVCAGVGLAARLLAITTGVKLLWETAILVHLGDKQLGSLKRTALLLKGALKEEAGARLVLGVGGGVLAPLGVAHLVDGATGRSARWSSPRWAARRWWPPSCSNARCSSARPARRACPGGSDGLSGQSGRLPDKLAELMHARTGPLTQELVRQPGGFGLGQVPTRLTPDATTTAVCGFCSTGCGLEIHLRNGEAINLSPARDYPVNRGTACPKGWEALTPLAAPDRATRPLVRNAGGKLVPASWDEAVGAMVSRFKTIGETHGPQSVAFLGTGQMPSEELAFLGALGEVRDGDAARRRQHAAVHGDRRRRVQAGVRLRRPALQLRRLRGVGRAGVRRLQPLHRAPDHVGARLQEPAQAGDRRHRSAQDGDRGRCDAAPARCGRSRTCRCSMASPTC